MVGSFIILGSARVPHVTVCSSWLSCFLVSHINSLFELIAEQLK